MPVLRCIVAYRRERKRESERVSANVSSRKKPEAGIVNTIVYMASLLPRQTSSGRALAADEFKASTSARSLQVHSGVRAHRALPIRGRRPTFRW